MASPVPPPSSRKLLSATAVAALAAAVVLVAAVLPAEYGVDPTGVGRALGFTRLAEPSAGPAAVEPERAAPPLFALSARWRLVEAPLVSAQGESSDLVPETRVPFSVNLTNVTTLHARLTWNDSGARGDTFEVSLRGPGEARSQLVQATNAPGAQGEAVATLAWRAAPFPQESDGALVVPLAEDASARGEWIVLVRLYGTGGEPEDAGNAWNLTVWAERYEAEVSREAERAGDRVRLTLQPGGAVEYKFRMQPGATLRYAWSATGPLYYDFHAEEDGAPAEAFTRFAEGVSDGEEGELTATFSGTHGWYWQNRGAAPVTVTLDTTGDYVIVGVPR